MGPDGRSRSDPASMNRNLDPSSPPKEGEKDGAPEFYDLDVRFRLKGWASPHIRYYGVPTNRYALAHFRFMVAKFWHHVLARRSQQGRVPWERMKRLIARWLPPAHIYHPYPWRRLRVTT